MITIEKELDRVLTLLRNKIRERGFTQLEVQEALSWGRSYISQLLTKQKSLRVEQVLLILDVIGVDPAEFFGELYHFPQVGMRMHTGEYGDLHRGQAPYNVSAVADSAGASAGSDLAQSLEELRSLLRGLIRLLVDKDVIEVDALNSALKSTPGQSAIDDL